MAINIYQNLPELEKAVKEVFSDSYEAEIRQPNMLIVLIHEAIIKGEKIKIGGKLSRMVKDNKDQLTEVLKSSIVPADQKNGTKKGLPKYGYLRVNKIGADSDIEEVMDSLKEQGYKKLKRVGNTHIIQINNSKNVD